MQNQTKINTHYTFYILKKTRIKKKNSHYTDKKSHPSVKKIHFGSGIINFFAEREKIAYIGLSDLTKSKITQNR